MSLNFDLTAMKKRLGQEEYDRITDHPTKEGQWHPVTDALIWACMYVGMPGITEKTVGEFVDRLAAYQAVGGPLLQYSTGGVYITEADVRNHIGLSTNVSKESAATFKTKLWRMALDVGKRSARLQEASAFETFAAKTKEAAE